MRYYAVTAIDRFGNESPAAQEAKPTFELPQHINVPRLINHDLKDDKKDATKDDKKASKDDKKPSKDSKKASSATKTKKKKKK